MERDGEDNKWRGGMKGGGDFTTVSTVLPRHHLPLAEFSLCFETSPLPRIKTQAIGRFSQPFWYACHCRHIPRIKTQPWVVFFWVSTLSAISTISLASKSETNVDFFGHFNASSAGTTSLAPKCNREVVFFSCSDAFATATTSLMPKCEREMVFCFLSAISTGPRSPPCYLPHVASPNASRRMFSTWLPPLNPLHIPSPSPPSTSVPRTTIWWQRT